jgi:hypothetical protein
VLLLKLIVLWGRQVASHLVIKNKLGWIFRGLSGETRWRGGDWLGSGQKQCIELCGAVMDQLAVVIKRRPFLGVMVFLFVNGKRRCWVSLSHSLLNLKDVLR